jgi:beta-lactamase regulating signal transducer with metallopeptidase domain
MTAVAHWLSPDLLRTLGLSLLHFLWQGAALATLAAGLLAAARTASTRYAIAIAVLVLMVAAPVTTYFLLHESEPVANASLPNTSLESGSPAIATVVKLATVKLATHRAIDSTQARALSGGLLTVFVELWFIGVMLFSLRTAGGFLIIARLRRRDSKPMHASLLALCCEMQRCLGIARAIRYCESLHLDAPAVVGWFRPVVLLPITALSGLTELQLRAVIAHELAHIRRFDAFFNLFQAAAETLLFYHPAVWWLSKRIRAERENCCDDVALSLCGNPAEYARALALMEQWRAAPSFAMAANRGPLASRVTRLLGLTEKGSSLRNAGFTFGILCLAAALVAGNALFGVVRTASAHSSGKSQTNLAQFASETPIIITAPRPSPQSKSAAKQTPSQSVTPAAQPAPKSQSYIEGLKAEGIENLSADELISLKVQDVTPQYIREIRAEGLKPSIDELIAMKVQGITPEYIHQVRAMKLNVDVDSLIGMKVQGITPDYVDEMRKLGYPTDTDHLIAMKVQGITPEYVHHLSELNIHPDADDLIGMKVQGIDANYVRSIRAAGLNPDKDEWIALKVQGVTEDFIKGLQGAGFKPDVEEVVSAKVMGITPQFIELARSHGFKNLDLNKLIQLKHANVLE